MEKIIKKIGFYLSGEDFGFDTFGNTLSIVCSRERVHSITDKLLNTKPVIMDTFKTIKFLRPEDHQHLRVIRCKGKEYNRYTLFLFYLRDFKYEELDDLDNAILESLNQTQDAVFELNQKILFEGQLEEILSRYRLEEIKNITIQLSPIITDELIRKVQIGKEVFSYLKYFKASFRKGLDFMHLSDYFVAYLDNEKLIQLHTTMKAL